MKYMRKENNNSKGKGRRKPWANHEVLMLSVPSIHVAFMMYIWIVSVMSISNGHSETEGWMNGRLQYIYIYILSWSINIYILYSSWISSSDHKDKNMPRIYIYIYIISLCHALLYLHIFYGKWCSTLVYFLPIKATNFNKEITMHSLERRN